MTNDQLLALIENEERQCISSTSGALAEQRREAMQYYYGQPYGNEIEGRSQVVTTEVKDAVEGILPSLMAIFTSSDEIVRFEPQEMGDEAAAQQATDYVNYLFSRSNNGFLTLYCLFKDALLQKNGYAKVYWEDYTDSGIETYENLTSMEVALMLQQDQSLQLDEAELIENTDIYKKAVFRREKSYGKVCIDPVPPEEVLISKETPNELTKAGFVEHRTKKTISEVRKMGFDVEDDVADFAPGAEFNEERVERHKFDDADAITNTDTPDPASRKVWLCEAYLHVDYDGDGIAEYRKVTKIGKTVLDNVEFDSLPIVGGTAIPMPHKHYGLSVHDLVGDIQLIKSTITRQLLDNAYVANNGEYEVLDGMANMDDLLTSRPNGIKRVRAIGSIKRIDKPLLGAPFYDLLEYFDRVKTNRVGARDFGDAVDPNALNAKAHTAELVSNAAQERINLMARILAETVVKQLFWKILELVSKHQQKPQIVKLRNQWVQVDPREWRNKFNMTVTVGLGTGSQAAVLQGAMGVMQIQQSMLQLGLMNRTVTEANIFHAAKKYAKAVFPKDAEALFTDPSSLPPPEPQPNPDLIKLELQDKWKQMADAQKRDKMMQEERMASMEKMFEEQKQVFLTRIDQMEQEKDRRAETAKQLLQLISDQKKMVMEKMAEADIAVEEDRTEKERIVLQGKVDSLIEQQKQQSELLHKVMELAAAEREHEVSERDQKGKIKKTVSRPKKKDK